MLSNSDPPEYLTLATYGKCISIECSSSSASRDITSKSPVARSSSFIARSMFKSYRGVRYYQYNGNGLTSEISV